MFSLFSTFISLLSALAAVISTAVYVLLIWWIDRYEKEPLKLLVIAFLWGAMPAVLAASVVETVFDAPLIALSPNHNQLLSASFIAPPVEEFLKALALLSIFYLARHEFDGVLDGIIYGSLVGFGFAMTENLFYFWGAGGDDLVAWSMLVLGRTVVFGFNHAMFTSFTGIGFGLARYAKSPLMRWGSILVGLVAAITVHSFHNLFLSLEDLCLISLASDWLGVLLVLVIIVLTWRREQSWIKTQLAGEVSSGVLSPSQFRAITSRWERFRHTWHLLGASGLSQARLWRKLASTATELAFKKHQRAVMGNERGNDATIVSLRTKLLCIRQRLGDES